MARTGQPVEKFGSAPKTAAGKPGRSLRQCEHQQLSSGGITMTVIATKRWTAGPHSRSYAFPSCPCIQSIQVCVFFSLPAQPGSGSARSQGLQFEHRIQYPSFGVTMICSELTAIGSTRPSQWTLRKHLLWNPIASSWPKSGVSAMARPHLVVGQGPGLRPVPWLAGEGCGERGGRKHALTTLGAFVDGASVKPSRNIIQTDAGLRDESGFSVASSLRPSGKR